MASPDWHLSDLFTVAGLLLGALGLLYLIYGLLDCQQKALQRWLWFSSSGLLLASVLMTCYIFVFGTKSVASGYSTGEVWRLAWALGFVGIMILRVSFPLSPEVRPPLFLWHSVLFPVVLSGVLLGGIGAVLGSQNLVETAAFVFPGVFVIGLLNGFSPAMQWEIVHLPKNRLAAIGVILLLCAIGLGLVQPMANLMGLSLH